jgi:hypothetical protein
VVLRAAQSNEKSTSSVLITVACMDMDIARTINPNVKLISTSQFGTPVPVEAVPKWAVYTFGVAC